MAFLSWSRFEGNFRVVLFVVVLCFVNAVSGVASQSQAVGIQPGDVPNPILHYAGCGRESPSYICDQHGILKSENLKDAYKRIDAAIAKLADVREPKPCRNIQGYEVGVALIKKMALSSWANVDKSAEKFARIVHDNWGIGDATCGNGILVFVSIEDRVAYISTGKSAMDRVTSSRASAVVSKMGPLFAQQRYTEGLEMGLAELEKYVKGKPPSKLLLMIWNYALPTFFFSVIAYVIYKDYKENQERTQARRQLRRLENDRNKLLQNNFDISSCPVCLEDLTFPETDARKSGNSDDNGAQERDEDINDVDGLDGSENQENGSLVPKSNDEKENNVVERRDSKYFRRRLMEKLGHGEKKNKNNERRQSQTRRDRNSRSHDEGNAKDPFALKCGHIFCNACIMSWLEKNNTCPICRETVGDSSVS
mmetsp:Transcript_10723/g.12262  ORF Transcript_10723/g.12262 Transcript_10723/m.12262 type:complete len:423 (-) Transcript_10723:1249-2517(-)